MKATSVSIFNSALLRVEDAPTVHDELTRRLGTPDTCFNEPPDQRGSLWVIESPASARSDINEHFTWASSLVERHSDFLRALVTSGVRVTLHLACNTNLGYALIGFDTALFSPFVHTGIEIEFYAGFDSTNVA